MEIAQLAKAKLWIEALSICSKRPQPILLGLVAQRGRQWQTGLSMPPSWWRSLAYLRRVRMQGEQADVVAYNSASSSCARAAPWAIAAKLVQDLRLEMLRPTASSYNGLMSGAWSQNVEILRRLQLQSVRATPLSYGSFMRCLPDWHRSWQLLRDMRARAQESNVILQTSVVQACEAMEQWQEASELLEDASSQSCANLLTFSTCISAYVKGTEWLRALLLNAGLQKRQLQANKITYTTAMHACVKGTRWKAAIHWFVDADIMALSAATDACAKSLQWAKVLWLSDASDDLLDVAINTCTRSSRWSWALSCFGRLSGEMKLLPHIAAIGACEKTVPTHEFLGLSSSLADACHTYLREISRLPWDHSVHRKSSWMTPTSRLG